MERTMSVEEKIKRAEEIYQKRRQGTERQIATVNLNENKKELKLFKKTIIQILICTVIYFIISSIYNSDYIFSKDFTNKVKEILSYDINFYEIYNNIKYNFMKTYNKVENEEVDKNNGQEEQGQQEDKKDNIKENKEKEEKSQEAIGGAVEEEKVNEVQQLSQVEQDIIDEENAKGRYEYYDRIDVKNTTTFIKPIEGVISSKYGIRETATGNVPKNHTGTDIAANLGTKIKSSTDGEVVLASEEGDYGKHLKIQIGDVSIIYAHCNILYVKQGEKIIQGQEIAEVGSTGNSTGPHLHFEIRIFERNVDPEKILEL